MNEHDRQIPTRVALPERHVYIFSRALSFFKETELGSIVKHLLHFLLLDAELEASLSITSRNQMIPLILINTALQRQKIREQFLPFSRHDRFRMKLHALDFQLAMAQTHDDAVNSTRRDL